MNDLKVFNSTEFGELGVMLIDGKEYFPATQCAKILGYSNPQKAIRDHCKTDGCTKCSVIDSLGRTQQMKFINEGNLYRLIVSSKLPAAERFERFVFDEVLPSIRKNGSYGTADINEIIAKTASAVVSEVVRQLAPMLSAPSELKPAAPTVYKKRRKAMGIITRLESGLQKQIDDMLLSDRYSYQDIVNFLAGYGISISTASVCRYNARLHEPTVIVEEYL